MKQATFIASLFGVAISAEQEWEISCRQHSSLIFATRPNKEIRGTSQMLRISSNVSGKYQLYLPGNNFIYLLQQHVFMKNKVADSEPAFYT